jgi:hypothetical protein
MAGINLTSASVPVSHKQFGGGLNSTSGPLNLQDNEASDLQNVDFNKFGSVLKRNGYTALNTSAITSTPDIDGLHWYEADLSGTKTRELINQAGDKVYKMDDLDGTWDDITGSLTITAGSHASYENWLNSVWITNGTDPPYKWDGTGNAEQMTVPTGLTDAKYVAQFNNYLFLANVVVSGTVHESRFYWSTIKDGDTWTATDFIDVSKDDGQEITGMIVLGDRLVIFKERSIYNVFFTGDNDIPFVLPNGGKSNSSVGCIAPFSIQEIENGLVFLSHDGFYFYDGNNSLKLSDRITTTLLGYNTTLFNNARSLVQPENDVVVVWDWFNNAWSLYIGMAPSAMTTVYVGGKEERPYWGDYAGFVYRGDTGDDDYPLNVQTAISAYYQTNWKSYDDIVDQKAVPQIVIYFQNANTVLELSYSYDFEDEDSFSQTFSLGTSTDTYGSGVYDTAVYAGSGGDNSRRDLDGRGRVVRFKVSNATLSETFQIDGIGPLVHLETNV